MQTAYTSIPNPISLFRIILKNLLKYLKTAKNIRVMDGDVHIFKMEFLIITRM